MKRLLKFWQILAALTILVFFVRGALAETPKNISLVSWGVGSMFHSMSSAVADGVKKTSNIKTSIIPSSNDIGRLLPVKTGEAEMFIAAGSTG